MVSSINKMGHGNNKTVRQKTLDSTVTGMTISGISGFIIGGVKQSWLNNSKNAPSDAYIKKVSQVLENNLSEQEKIEHKKVNNFFASLVDSNVTLDNLRGQIESSEELKEALPLNKGETAQDAINRIFSNKNSKEVKDLLANMQDKTKVDKKVNKLKAKSIINSCFDKVKKKLVKSEDVTKEEFDILIKAKNKLKIHSAITTGIVLGVLGAIAGMTIGAKKYNKSANK